MVSRSHAHLFTPTSTQFSCLLLSLLFSAFEINHRVTIATQAPLQNDIFWYIMSFIHRHFGGTSAIIFTETELLYASFVLLPLPQPVVSQQRFMTTLQ